MGSRMEKYYRAGKTMSRAVRNQDLYRTIYDIGEYSNIEGIASIEKTNQIDLNQIRELLKKANGEEKKEVIEPAFEKTERTSTSISLLEDEEKSYDIRDVLNKAKSERGQTSSRHHNLDNTQYNILKRIKIDEANNITNINNDEQELKELIHTITNTSMLKKLGDQELSLDLLSSLKAGEETLIREREAFEVSNNTEQLIKPEMTSQLDNIDKSFFTSSLNFSEEDFEDLKDIGKTLKKNNLLIKFLTILLVVIIIAVVGYIVYTFYQR